MALKFHYAAAPGDEAVDYLANSLKNHLASGENVLWLLSGGSNVGVEASIAGRIQEEDLSRLSISLIDERYGNVGHADSNWQKLVDAGFKLDKAIIQPVLIEQNFDSTIRNFDTKITELFKAADYRIGLFGMGEDGHTAGLLPGIVISDETAMVVGYKAADYERISLTPTAIAVLDEAVLVAQGEVKWAQLKRLQSDIPVVDQPVQILKRVPNVTIFCDDKEL